jgi:hypothetical protein
LHARPPAARPPAGFAHACAPPLCGSTTPRAQELELTEGGGAALIPQVLAQPSAPRLRSLKMSIGVGGGRDAFTPVWAAPWFSQLRELSLATDQGLGSPGLAPLRAAPLLQKLSIRKVVDTRALTAADGRALAAAALPELRELRLRGMEPGLVAALVAAPWLSQLEWLDLEGDYEGSAGGLAAADGRALAAAPLASLTRLNIVNAEPSFMAACVAAAWMSRLQRLHLRGPGGLPEGSPAWAATPFTALVSLTLDHRGPPEASRFAALVAAPWFGRLQHLELGGFPVGSGGGPDGAGLRALAAAPLPKLASLCLSEARLSAADVSGVLSSAPWLPGLTSLALAFNDLGAPGHRALSRLHLPRLQTLSLKQNGFDCAGLAALVSAPWLTQLGELTLGNAFESEQNLQSAVDAIEDDAWVFGHLRRLGCVVRAQLIYDPPDDELGSDTSSD